MFQFKVIQGHRCWYF